MRRTAMRQPLKQKSRDPVHCAFCIQSGHDTPATWLVTGTLGAKSLAACDAHVDRIERHGIHALKHHGRKHPL